MAFNSTIKQRTGKCSKCPYTGPLIGGKCNSCYWKGRNAISKTKTLKVERPTKPTIVEVPEDSLYDWFDQRIKDVAKKPYCWNCPKKVSLPFYFHAVAHIIPKSIFESVATHENNWLLLPAGCCHGIFDSSIERASKMPVFKLAVERFKTFEHLITEKHKHLDLFVETAIKLNYY